MHDWLPTAPGWVVALHLAATLAMTGLIWFVQIVHYPLYAAVGREAFPAYHAQHVERTTRVVAGPMLIELGTATWLFLAPNDRFNGAYPAIGLGLLVLIWLSTAFLQVPSHGRLQAVYTPTAHRFLVRTNWLRTVGWTLRSLLVLAALWMQASMG